MTERIYDYDSHVMTFSARVLSCTPKDDAFEIVLDRSAFSRVAAVRTLIPVLWMEHLFLRYSKRTRSSIM